MSSNRIILEGCIEQFKKQNDLSMRDSVIFELFCLTQITKKTEILYENILNSVVDGSMDGGIDSILILINNEVIESIADLEEVRFDNRTETKIIISQCKKESSFKESALDKLIATVPELFDLEKNETALLSRFNSDLVLRAMIIRKAWMDTSVNGGYISVVYTYACNADKIEINSAFDSKVKQLKNLTKNQFLCESVECEIYSSAELLSLYQTRKSNRLVIQFKDQPLSTTYGDGGIGYMGTVKLSDYKKFLALDDGTIRDDLFESNIRHFLQSGVDVNKSIKKTIEEDIGNDFWWLNNGVTIIAELPNQIGKQLSIENVQIVNGLQTSYSVFNATNIQESDQRSVLVKVIINSNKETIDNIIGSTNNQNPVSPTLLRATGAIQRKIELFFANNGYYYDRRKNYYKNQGKPATKIFSIQYTAQAIRAIGDDDPHTARARPTSLLKDDKTYSVIFNEERSYEGFLKCCLINKKTHDFWLNMEDHALKSETANFKLHLSCLIPKVIYQQQKVTFEQLAKFNLENFTQDVYTKSLSLLISSLASYRSQNPNANLINMAKSKEFTNFILKSLEF